MAAGTGASFASDYWWRVLATALNRQVNPGGVGGISYDDTAALQLADYRFTNRVAIYWAGHHGTDAPADVAALASMIAHQTGNKRFLILQPVMADAFDSNIVTKRNAYLTAYPNNCVDVPAMLALHGDGSANDNADIAAGLTPRSLKVDTIHLNSTGQAYVADLVRSTIQAKGW